MKSYQQHFRETLILAFPVIIGQLGTILMGVVDSMMVGSLGYEYLSAATLGNNVYFQFAILGIGLPTAVAALVAEAEGANDPERGGAYLRQSLWVGLGIAAIVMLIVYFLGEYALPHMGQPQRDVELAQPFMMLLNISTIPLIIFLLYKNFTDGLSLTRVAMFATIGGLAVNIFLNWLLIYGNWGFPRMELNGAGVATLTARVMMMLAMIFYVRLHPRFAAYKPKMRWREFDKAIVRKILSIGLPSAGQWFFEIGAFAGASVLLGMLANGSLVRSAHQIALSAASVSFMVITGISAAATIRVGNGLGANDRHEMRRAGWVGFALGAAFMVISGISFILFKHQIVALYQVPDPEVVAISEQLLLLAAAFAIFDGLQGTGIGVLRGAQDIVVPTIVTFVAYWLVSLPLGSWLTFTQGYGVYGMWYGFIVALAIAAVAHIWRFWYISNKK